MNLDTYKKIRVSSVFYNIFQGELNWRWTVVVLPLLVTLISLNESLANSGKSKIVLFAIMKFYRMKSEHTKKIFKKTYIRDRW